jgi:hypothetical protein
MVVLLGRGFGGTGTIPPLAVPGTINTIDGFSPPPVLMQKSNAIIDLFLRELTCHDGG